MRRGFSVAELLIVIAILAVVAAITFPVFVRAKRSAKETVSMSNLRQIWSAIELYRQNQDSNPAETGRPDAMALPPSYVLYPTIIEKNGLNIPFRGSTRLLHQYIYYAPDTDGNVQKSLIDRWVAWTQACEGNTILLADFNFNDRPLNIGNGFVTTKGIGVTLGGHSTKRHSRGDVFSPSWWGCPQQTVLKKALEKGK